MKCPKCGFELRETDKFCSECGTSLKKERQENKSKNYTYKKYACIISFIILLVLILGFGLRSCVLNFVGKQLEYKLEYSSYDFENMTIDIPSNWTKQNGDDGITYFYDSKDNMLMISTEMVGGNVTTEEDFNEFVDGVSSNENISNFVELSREYINIDGNYALNLKCRYNVSFMGMYNNFYVFTKDNILYSIVFGSWGFRQSKEFDVAEHTILDSIKVSDSVVLEETTIGVTEELTTEVTTTEEPTTEKSTEPPTEKPTEATIMNNTSTDGFWAEGSGDYVATGLNVTRYGVLHIEYSGEGHFSVISYEGDDYDELLVNTTDYYSGDVLIDHSGSFSLEISASEGSWSISSSGLSIDDSTSFSGRGDSVTGLTSHDGGIWEITHNGSRHFSVIEYGYSEGYMDLLVNETGSYSGTVKAESGDNIFFKVSADGEWSINKK